MSFSSHMEVFSTSLSLSPSSSQQKLSALSSLVSAVISSSSDVISSSSSHMELGSITPTVSSMLLPSPSSSSIQGILDLHSSAAVTQSITIQSVIFTSSIAMLEDKSSIQSPSTTVVPSSIPLSSQISSNESTFKTNVLSWSPSSSMQISRLHSASYSDVSSIYSPSVQSIQSRTTASAVDIMQTSRIIPMRSSKSTMSYEVVFSSNSVPLEQSNPTSSVVPSTPYANLDSSSINQNLLYQTTRTVTITQSKHYTKSATPGDSGMYTTAVAPSSSSLSYSVSMRVPQPTVRPVAVTSKDVIDLNLILIIVAATATFLVLVLVCCLCCLRRR